VPDGPTIWPGESSASKAATFSHTRASSAADDSESEFKGHVLSRRDRKLALCKSSQLANVKTVSPPSFAPRTVAVRAHVLADRCAVIVSIAVSLLGRVNGLEKLPKRRPLVGLCAVVRSGGPASTDR
jgi:hypothetical protein